MRPESTRTQLRALVREPASLLASEEDRERGYSLRWSSPGFTRDEVRRGDWGLSHSEESLASVVRWQSRTVAYGPWVAAAPPE